MRLKQYLKFKGLYHFINNKIVDKEVSRHQNEKNLIKEPYIRLKKIL